MPHYKDRTYCPFALLCNVGHSCDKALTQEVQDAATKAQLPVARYSEFPPCFTPFFEVKHEK